MRLSRVLALTALLGSTLTAGVATTAAPAAADGIWCGADNDSLCVATLEVEGEELPFDGPGGAWTVVGSSGTGGFTDLSWYLDVQVQRRVDGDGPYTADLGPGRPQVHMNLRLPRGDPRAVVAQGADVTVTRLSEPDEDYWNVVVTGRPVEVGGAGADAHRFRVVVSDLRGLTARGLDATDAEGQQAVRDALHGLDVETDATTFDLPPTVVVGDAPRLDLSIRNGQYREDGTLVRGRATVRLPGTLLQHVLGIPDPGSLRPKGLASALRGRGAGDVSVARDGDGMRITATGVTYPRERRVLRVETGRITPTKPKKVVADRVRKRRGVVRFQEARPQGAEVTGHRVVCKAAKHKVKATTTRPKVAVKKLRKNTAYTCKVRALSDVGAGKWSAKKRLPPRP